MRPTTPATGTLPGLVSGRGKRPRWSRGSGYPSPEHGLDVDNCLCICHVVLLGAHRALLVHNHQVVGIDDAALQQAVQAGQFPKRRAQGQPLETTQGSSTLQYAALQQAKAAPNHQFFTCSHLLGGADNLRSQRWAQLYSTNPGACHGMTQKSGLG